MKPRNLSRRATLCLATAATLPLVHIRTAGAAGKLAVMFFDSPVAGASDVLRKLIDQWGRMTKTEVRLDLVDVFGDRVNVIQAEEAHAQDGHDILPFWIWHVHEMADQLEPMDDLVKSLQARYGALSPVLEYLLNVEGSYRGLPSYWVNTAAPCCSRIDLFKQYVGMDLQAVFPAADAMGPGYEAWTWDKFADAAQKCADAGYPFGLPMSNSGKADHFTGALFRAHGAALADVNGNITVRSDNVRQVLEYAKRLMRSLPPAVYGWDNTSNNKALVAGKAALICNSPSAWKTAVRDNPQVGEQCWTHPTPAGPAGRFIPYIPNFWVVWRFARNKTAAKELMAWLYEREQAEQLLSANDGYDTPPFTSMANYTVWADAGPPKGTLFNYPVRPAHHSELTVAGYPASPELGIHIANESMMPAMIARVAHGGEPIEQVIDWAEEELAGVRR